MTETWKERCKREAKENAELESSMTPERRAVTHALWRSVATGDHLDGPVADFGRSSERFLEALAELGFQVVPGPQS